MRGQALAAALALALTPSTGGAQPDAPPAEDARPEASPPLRTERRVAPDYDGRPSPGPDAGEVLLWIPRVLFFPVTAVLDYGLRRPIGFLIEVAERENWDQALLDVFTFDAGRGQILPRFLFAYGFQPSGGLRYTWRGFEGHRQSASLSVGGVDYVVGAGGYEVRFLPALRVGLRGEGGRRPDRIFSGVGWDTPGERFRFRETWYRAGLSLEVRPWRRSGVQAEVAVDGHDFDPNGYVALRDSPSLADALAANAFPRPDGLDGYTAMRQSLRAWVDTRLPEPHDGSGMRAEAFGQLAFDVHDPGASRWLRWGVRLGAFLDLGHHRVLGLWGVARFADPLGRAPLPFTELVTVGEEWPLLNGFLRGQLRGRSALVTALEYRYPIWVQLDGRVHVAIGNAFDAHLGDLEVERLRLSFGIGIDVIEDFEETFTLSIAAGTAPFVSGAAIDSVQLLIGTRNGP